MDDETVQGSVKRGSDVYMPVKKSALCATKENGSRRSR